MTISINILKIVELYTLNEEWHGMWISLNKAVTLKSRDENLSVFYETDIRFAKGKIMPLLLKFFRKYTIFLKNVMLTYNEFVILKLINVF